MKSEDGPVTQLRSDLFSRDDNFILHMTSHRRTLSLDPLFSSRHKGTTDAVLDGGSDATTVGVESQDFGPVHLAQELR